MSVVDPDRWLSPFMVPLSPPGLRGQKGVDEPGRSRLMSQNGSIVVETPLEGIGKDKNEAPMTPTDSAAAREGKRTMTSSLGSKFTQDGCLFEPAGGWGVRACMRLFPLLLSCSSAILLNIASLENWL